MGEILISRSLPVEVRLMGSTFLLRKRSAAAKPTPPGPISIDLPPGDDR
jgi:hypothetical protein